MQRPVLKDTVLGITPVKGSAGGMQLQLASGMIVTAGAVVYAAAGGKLKRSEWWDSAVASSNVSDHTKGTLQMAYEVRLPDLDLAGGIGIKSI